MKNMLQKIAVYIMLLLILALGAWLFLLGREVLSGMMSTYYVGKSFIRGYQAGFFDKLMTLVMGLGWLVLFVVSEELLRRSVNKGRMKMVFARFFGVELLAAFVLDGLMVFLLTSISAAGWARLLLLVGELILGAVFVFLGWSKRSPWYVKHIPPGVLGAHP